ncbi:MAG: DMT family transporter [Nitrospirota bacterium]|nr:DMT family transporter [Nitrospirota bacterium]
MSTNIPISQTFNLVPPQLLVVISRGLQALAIPVVALLITTAATLGGEVKDAISFCNVLFVGNLCASLVVLVFFGPKAITHDLKRLRFPLFLEVLGLASLAVLLSTLIFNALQTTTVTNVVLLARLGPVLYVIGAAALLGQIIGKLEWAGFGLIALGALATVFTESRFTITTGDLLILASTGIYAIITLMSKRLLPETGVPALLFARNFFSAIVFFIIANVLFGPAHFGHAFYGPLWVIMAVYALIIIVASQIAWYQAIETLPPANIAKWTFFTPILAVSYAYFLNGERPSIVQIVALGLITIGLVMSNIGSFFPKGSSDNPEGSVAASS